MVPRGIARNPPGSPLAMAMVSGASSRQAGEDALQVTVTAPLPRSAMEQYYKGALTRNGWRLVNTAKDPEGALVLLAERDGRPLWVKISSAADTAWSMVEFSGARMARGSKPAT